MPLYEYKCAACEQVGEYLQKINDPAPEACRFCGKGPLQKKVSQSAFVLKGQGWYVTDFRDKSGGTPASGQASANDAAETSSETPKTDAGKSETTPAKETTKSTTEAKPATSDTSTSK